MRRIWRSTIKSFIRNYDSIATLKMMFFEIRWRHFRRNLRERETLKTLGVFAMYLFLFGAVVYLIRLGYSSPWAGLVERDPKSGAILSYKTVWDWLELFLIPLFLALIAYGFSQVQNKTEKKISLANSRSVALRDYFDRMTDLIISGQLNSRSKKSNARIIARARTLTILDDLSPEQKGYVLRFLKESNLITNPKPIIEMKGMRLISLELFPPLLDSIYLYGVTLDNAKLPEASFYQSDLSGASLANADLEWANFQGVNLNYSYLPYANLYNADLRDAQMIKVKLLGSDLRRARLTNATMRSVNLENADLRDADLTNTYLQTAKLIDTNLSGAILVNADLTRSTLWGANLKNADLTGANLTDAFVTWKQLRSARSIKGVKMSRNTEW